MASSSIDTIREIRENAEGLRGTSYGEADTIRNLIDPVLEFLQYPSNQQRREEQVRQNRPDIVLWDSPDQLKNRGPATLIIEAKPLRADLEGNGKAKQNRPKEQLARYVTGYDLSGPATLGILSDGNIWHVVKAVPDDHRTDFLKEIQLLEGTEEEAAKALDELHHLILEGKDPFQVRPSFAIDARKFTNAIADEKKPGELLSLLAGIQDVNTDLTKEITLEGTAEHAEQAHWESYAFGYAGKVETHQKALFDEGLCVAVVRMERAEDENDRSVYRPDVATAATAFARTALANVSVVVVIQPDEEGNSANARLAVHYQGHTSMTIDFNPNAPPPHVLNKIQLVYERLWQAQPIQPSNIADIVAARGVRKQYYIDIAEGWVLRQYHKVQDGDPNKSRQHRQSILRHLMRTLFVWILKEEGILPQEAFDPVFAGRHAAGEYHQKVLTYLFHERLNIPRDKRKPHPVSEINTALQNTRFLNGSIFARHKHDGILNISDDDYFGDDPENPGLFTILSNYEWTAAEHTPAHSDQTIDPEVLSNLFENLIAVTESDETPDRMPEGTYYTPADVAKEMAKDALMLAVKPYAPPHWSEEKLLMLFDDDNASMPVSSEERKKYGSLVQRISNLTIFDPSVGSGVFPLSILAAIRAALLQFDGNDDDGSLTRRIISQQLYAQDIHPMAVQITRLRLMIAIMAAEQNGTHPLPNLEAKIVCANTLSTIPRRNWKLSATGGLQDVDPTIVSALSTRADLLHSWQNAHEESAKLALRKEDERLRDELKQAVQDSMVSAETVAFADFSLLDPDAPPVHTDPRLIFYHPDWQGFDVVIGNPPYEEIAKGQSAQKKKKVKGTLRDRGYTTVPCNDLYALITEAGLALTRPDAGVLSLIVMLNICFGKNKQPLRKLIEKSSSQIWLRSHDNRPEPIFRESPVAHPENRQRTTILNAVMSRSEDEPEILVTGTNKWLKSERHEFLAHRSYNPLPKHVRGLDTRLDNQWELIPTREIADLITAMRGCQYHLKSLSSNSGSTKSVGFPKTAYEFLTVVPSGRLTRREVTIQVGDQDNQALAVAAANSHVAYAWWRTYGDAFDVTPVVMSNLPIPAAWVETAAVRKSAIALGRKLIEEIRDSNIIWRTSGTRGTRHQSLDFHECAPDTIAEIDRLYLMTLGLPSEPLLPQMRTLRSNSTWRL